MPADTSTKTLSFSNYSNDDEIRFQLIIRYTNNEIKVHHLMKSSDSDLVELTDRARINEIVFVAYTANYNPITSEKGRVYGVLIEGI